MANIKSSAKRDQLSKKANAKNRAAKTLMKTNLKRFDAAVEEGDKAKAEQAYRTAVKTVDKAAGKNLIHKNNASNKKRGLTKRLNSMQ